MAARGRSETRLPDRQERNAVTILVIVLVVLIILALIGVLR